MIFLEIRWAIRGRGQGPVSAAVSAAAVQSPCRERPAESLNRAGEGVGCMNVSQSTVASGLDDAGHQCLVVAFLGTTVLQTKIFSESVNPMHSGVKYRHDTDVVV
ncbi:hypothetical protein GCM10009125_16540 [Castellaniella daejeonensis]|uniref:Uncharacterized protein n=1 Tax=Castellaniella daejeonensis TaxID=659013 RepID=A0ABN0TRC4_9BURK